MGNARKFGRKINKVNGESHDTRPGAEVIKGHDYPGPGRYNAYRCEKCSLFTVVVHVDAGVTPMFLTCKTPDCDGMATSIGYPQGAVPEKLKRSCRFEWYRPDHKEWNRMEPEMKDHIARGGLALRER